MFNRGVWGGGVRWGWGVGNWVVSGIIWWVVVCGSVVVWCKVCGGMSVWVCKGGFIVWVLFLPNSTRPAILWTSSRIVVRGVGVGICVSVGLMFVWEGWDVVM